MFDDVRFSVRQEHYKDLLEEAKRERMLRRAARQDHKKARKQEKAAEPQPSPHREGGLVLQFRRLMSFLL
jgi:hypothetical protein